MRVRLVGRQPKAVKAQKRLTASLFGGMRPGFVVA